MESIKKITGFEFTKYTGYYKGYISIFKEIEETRADGSKEYSGTPVGRIRYYKNRKLSKSQKKKILGLVNEILNEM